MNKVKIIGQNKKVDLPKCFSGEIREDIAQKYYNLAKKVSTHSQSKTAGRTDSNKVRHVKEKFRSHYGRGISRVPRKIFWRRGTQFFWQAAGVPGVKGGRRAHPPKGLRADRRMNKKERKIAVQSAIASTASKKWLTNRYDTLNDSDNLPIENFPMIIDSKLLKLKTKEFLQEVEKATGELYNIAIKKKKIRKGRGKKRGRKFRKNRGVLLVIGNDEESNQNIIETRKVENMGIEDLWPLGRMAIYTTKAIEELREYWEEMLKNKQKIEVKK